MCTYLLFQHETTTKPLPKTHNDLREIVNSFLGSNDLIGPSWDVEHIVTAVNSAAEISTDGSQLMLTIIFLKKAYL